MPVNWLLSAVGRAYLAYCTESERQESDRYAAQVGSP